MSLSTPKKKERANFWKSHVVLALAALVPLLAGSAAFVLGAESAPGAEPQDFPPKWVQEDWGYWTQGSGRWIADNSAYKTGNEPENAYGMEWEMGLGGKSLKGRLFTIIDGEVVRTNWEYIYHWHPGEKKVMLYQWGRNGAFGLGTVKSTGENTTETLQQFYAPDGSTTQVGHRAERLPGEVRNQSYNVSEAGVWEENRSYVWKLSTK